MGRTHSCIKYFYRIWLKKSHSNEYNHEFDQLVSKAKLEERIRSSVAENPDKSSRQVFDEITANDPAALQVSFGSMEGSLHYRKKNVNQKPQTILII